MAFPYMDINFAKNLFNERFSEEDRQLMADIMMATGPPIHIEESVQNFVKSKMAGDGGYVSVHWRFNVGDWWHGGCDIRSDGQAKHADAEICKQLTYMRDPRNFAKQVDSFLTKSWKEVENGDGRVIPSVIKVI